MLKTGWGIGWLGQDWIGNWMIKTGVHGGLDD
jgi:hypothetical protein